MNLEQSEKNYEEMNEVVAELAQIAETGSPLIRDLVAVLLRHAKVTLAEMAHYKGFDLEE